ncbi:hypothetical protein CLU79DRAFT_486099 [Phycomyces nitens]|nr:hypothetical protein CLU79DRAFT_486099 [Phycomyces nitens]
MSSSSSDGTVTPPCDRHASPILLDNPGQLIFRKDATSAGLPQSRRHFAIPIHDPLDDLDSDTPIYKPEDHQLKSTDCTDVLGELSHTSSEDLMNKIYSRFTHTHHHRKTCNCGDSCVCATCKTHPGTTTPDRPAAVMDQDGVMLCGCGCQKALSNCSDCFQDMCEEYLLSHPHP